MATKQVQLHIRVDPEVRRTLKVVAAEQGKPLSQVVQEALLAWAEGYRPPHLDSLFVQLRPGRQS